MNKKIWFEKELLRSSAFRSLSKWAMLVYLDFLRKRQMEPVKRARRSDEWVIKNNGEIVYPYSEAEKKEIGRREFRNAIDELIEKGFLDIAHQGSGGRSGDMTKYILDDRWKEHGTPAFRPARNPRRKDTRGGRGCSAFHAKQQKSPVTKSLPKKAVSSSKTDTPKEKSPTLSSDRSATPKERKKKITNHNDGENKAPSQLSLWSNECVTIL
ncbi:hypothetical protein [Desulfofustis glycolicus]|uniref:Uncharacterized protein n=1 Tax=Desulfofustis glycolicus DSM 9705 TaxID=1121409 RepID=A0A1M5YMC6_9BACT|nr:hypothetical protein [Desulfofustis glycolicus]SHI12964.1 hypothetical protein SAMN02745124_04196 [Desulfofustis glycolicus DSM 9705]